MNPQTPSDPSDVNYNPYADTRDESINVGDNFELLTRFAMEQNLRHYGYGDELDHINKNLLLTSLSRKNGDVDEVINMCEIITILKRHVRTKEQVIDSGKAERHENADGSVTLKRIYIHQDVAHYRFKNLVNYFSTKLYARTSAAGGNEARLLQMLKSSFYNKEMTIEDKTETKQGFWLRSKKKSGE